MAFLILLPIFIFSIEIPRKKNLGRKVNRIWSKMFFGMLFFKVQIKNTHYLDTSKQYVFVANHFSYLDIPVLGLIPFGLVFIGKSSLAKVPLFGYMFKNLHIAVDRNNMKSRGDSVLKARECLDEGASIVFFPEGGISSEKPPQMARFKDGAFKLALSKQIPIIPVTLSYNHLILPDDGKFLLRYKRVNVVIHEPIPVEGLGPKGVTELKEKCFNTIQEQLYKDNKPLVKKKDYS
jgi:1-acyl-sn-glycerol-3-phosphate acyltransferase